MEVNAIGYFQFNNLIESRTPFVLLCLEGANVGHWYSHVFKLHYENIRTECEEKNVLEALQTKNIPKHFSIVVLDKSGTISPKISQQLENSGYINSFFVTGGVQGLESEKQNIF